MDAVHPRPPRPGLTLTIGYNLPKGWGTVFAVYIDEATLHEIVRRLVEAVVPDRIVMFGSRASGDARPDSDLD